MDVLGNQNILKLYWDIAVIITMCTHQNIFLQYNNKQDKEMKHTNLIER